MNGFLIGLTLCAGALCWGAVWWLKGATREAERKTRQAAERAKFAVKDDPDLGRAPRRSRNHFGRR